MKVEPRSGPALNASTRAAMQFDDVADDGEAESEAAAAPCGGRVGLAEAFEDVRQERRVDAAAGIADPHLDRRIAPLDRDLHPPTLGRELDRVREQIGDDLLQALLIAEHRGRGIEHGLNPDVPSPPRPGACSRSVCSTIALTLHRLDAEVQRARHDAADIEQVLDQLGLRSRIALDRIERALLTVGGHGAGAKHLHPAENGVERGAQLVADGGDEFVLGAIGRGQPQHSGR